MEGNNRCQDCGSTEFDVVDSYLKNKIICKNCRIIYQVDSDNGTLTPTGEEYNKQVVVDEERLDDHDTSMQTEERNIGEARMGLGTRRPKIIKDRKRQAELDRKPYKERRSQSASFDFPRMIDDLYQGLSQSARQNMIDDCKDLQTKVRTPRSKPPGPRSWNRPCKHYCSESWLRCRC